MLHTEREDTAKSALGAVGAGSSGDPGAERAPEAMRIGLDIGSTTTKVVVIDAQTGEVRYWRYRRHGARQAESAADALAAVGVCAPIATLISSFSFLVGIGGAPLFAMAMGEKREDQAKSILSNALYALVAVALFVTAIVLLFERPILMTFGASGTTYGYARRYLLIYAAGSVFPILTMGLSQYITAQGYSGMGTGAAGSGRG